MTQRYRKFKRRWGSYYAYDNLTGNSVTLKTRDKVEAELKVKAMNETERQPAISLSLARVYMNAADPKLGTRTWQEVMDHLAAMKSGETRRRWQVAIKDQNFDCIRRLPLAETRPEHFDRVLADGKVSTNVYLRRIHNHALGMEWLLKSVIPRLQWPKPVFGAKRAITAEEHAAIIGRELDAERRNKGSRNSDQPHYDERRDFYELLWHTGAAQSDAACLLAEDVDWAQRTICYSRKKLLSRGSSGIQPALIRFGEEVAAILQRRPGTGPLFPYLRTVRAGDRATAFKQRCAGLGIKGVTLHSYRYAWAERALKCGYPERFAQQALGHNSKAVHHAYAKHADVTVPSLDDWERQWGRAEGRMKKAEGGCQMPDAGYPMPKPAVVQVDFKAAALGTAGDSVERRPAGQERMAGDGVPVVSKRPVWRAYRCCRPPTPAKWPTPPTARFGWSSTRPSTSKQPGKRWFTTWRTHTCLWRRPGSIERSVRASRPLTERLQRQWEVVTNRDQTRPEETPNPSPGSRRQVPETALGEPDCRARNARCLGGACRDFRPR